MKPILFFLLLCPLLTQAQPDTLRPIRPQDLKPIDSDLVPAYRGRYGTTVRPQYMYDGLDVRRPTDLGPYIMASGNPDAIREFSSYITSRHTGGWLIATGILSAIIGTVIMSSNKPDADGKFNTTQYYSCPVGQYCGSGGGTLTRKVTDTQRQNAFGGGAATLFGGAIVAGIGVGMQLPCQHLRRAVQLYNRDLKQRGVSWQIQPYASFNASGIGLVGRF